MLGLGQGEAESKITEAMIESNLESKMLIL